MISSTIWHINQHKQIFQRPTKLHCIDLEQVLIHFISENDNSASRFVILRGQVTTGKGQMFGKAPSSVQIKACLEAPYLLTVRVFSIYVPHFQGISEMECLSPRTARLLLYPIQLQCLIYSNRWHEIKQMVGVAIFGRKSILHLDNKGVNSRRGIATVFL